MRTRLVSSVGVVGAGLLPAVAGGPIFAALMVTLGVIGFREFAEIARRLPTAPILPPTGYPAVAMLGLGSLLAWPLPVVIAIAAAIVVIPLPLLFDRAGNPGVVEGWALAVAGSFYLGLPIAAAIGLRAHPGEIGAAWLAEAADLASIGWPASPRGLAWVLVAIVVTWVADSGAFLVGKTAGRTRLAPRISPNKTVEGALGGLLGAVLAAVVLDTVLGLDLGGAAAGLVGALLAVLGQLGDLAESLLKRQAGVKDSGAAIPGHGGVLDRIDGLLVVLPCAWFLAWLLDGSGAR